MGYGSPSCSIILYASSSFLIFGSRTRKKTDMVKEATRAAGTQYCYFMVSFLVASNIEMKMTLPKTNPYVMRPIPKPRDSLRM